MASCPHASTASLTPPKPTDAVYREDCTLCFDSLDDPAGLDVCLHCFNGACAGSRNHSHLHAKQAAHPLAVNIKRTRKRKPVSSGREDVEPPVKMSKLEIKAETEEERWEVRTDVHCLDCGVAGIAKEGKVGEVVEGVMKANTFAKQEEVKAWELDITPCEHTLCLEQEGHKQIPSGELGQCADCELKENLWLCLTCGKLGCGRKQMGGLPGNSHARAHGDSTSHPVAVKLGSLTAEGNADIYCYACDDERTDPELVAHLQNWGIDIADRVKTEQSMTEMNVQQNLNFDFSMTTADGKEMTPLFGPGFTGLKNLGNSCYLASILQSLFAEPEFAERYFRPDEPIPFISKPAEDLETQLRKLADGLLSGRYSKPDPDFIQKDQERPAYQRGLAPSMLKHLIGRGHAEFSTMRQQDSFELLLHLLKLVSRSQQAAQGKYKEVSDPVEAFRFAMEQRLHCEGCMGVRYRVDEMENLSVAVPITRLPNPSSTEDTTMANGEPSATSDGKEKEKEQFEPVTLQHCLDLYTAPESVELKCSSCGHTGFTKQTLFKSFPAILAVNARRFEIVNWVPTKQDVPVLVDDGVLDFEKYRGKSAEQKERAGEVLLPEDDGEGKGKGGAGFVPNEQALEMLMGMGFSRNRCERALHATGNGDAEVAMQWLFEHMEDADIDDPLVLDAGAGGAGAIDPEKIESLGNMGFSAPQARQALRETQGDMERAVDWLFSHPDAQGEFDEPSTSTAAPPPTAEAKDAQPAQFRLSSIVCHKGSSIHAGHYVAFIRKTLPEGVSKGGAGGRQGWVLFNDEKVAWGADAEEMRKFAYVYFFRREGTTGGVV